MIGEESPSNQKQSGNDDVEKESKSFDKFGSAATEIKAQVSKNDASEPSGWGIDEIEEEPQQRTQEKPSEKPAEDVRPSEFSQKWQKKHDKMQKQLNDPVKFTSSESSTLEYIVQLQEMRDIMKYDYELFNNERIEKQKELDRREAELHRREAQFGLKEKGDLFTK